MDNNTSISSVAQTPRRRQKYYPVSQDTSISCDVVYKILQFPNWETVTALLMDNLQDPILHSGEFSYSYTHCGIQMK